MRDNGRVAPLNWKVPVVKERKAGGGGNEQSSQGEEYRKSMGAPAILYSIETDTY